MVVILVLLLLQLMKNWISSVDLGLGSRIVGVDLVESIHKRSIFGLDTTINRCSLVRALHITTHRLLMTTTSQVM